MKRVLLIALLMCAPSWAALYDIPITLTSSSTQIPGSQTNFTLLACANQTLGNGTACQTVAAFKLVANGGYVSSSSNEIEFSKTACSARTLTTWEPIIWTGTSGALVTWFLDSSLSTGQVLHACIDNSVSTFQGGSTGSAWSSNYGAIWHLQSASALTDATTNGNNGTNSGTTTTTGQFGGGVSFPTNSSISYTAAGPITTTQTTYTIDTWVYPTAWGDEVVVANGSGNPTLLLFNGSGQLQLYANGTGSYVTLSPAPSLNAWNHIVVTNSCNECANGALFYVNGVAAGTGTAYEAVASSGTGYIGSAFSTFFWVGKMAEVRLMWGTTLSANWITSEYAMESNPASFMTFGTATLVGGGVAPLSPVWIMGDVQ